MTSLPALDEPQSHVATILAADAVAYSRAMSRDETAALAALAASRRIIDPAITQHGGRIFATAGDSVLAEFAGTDAAVRCAVAIQQSLADAGRSNARAVLVYRIGVHRGRVYSVGDDLLGDTVNVAARLESLANPGGVFVSGQVRDQLGQSPEVELEELGLQILKNIRDPVRVARVRIGEAEREHGIHGMHLSIAVMPLRDEFGGDLDYLAEGLADDLIAGLSRFRTLAVLARSSTFAYQHPHVDPRRVANDLDVNFVVQGSMARRDGRMRIAVELIEGRSGRTLWAERYDSSDLIAVQDGIVATLVATLVGRIEEAAMELARRKRPDSLEAFDLYLQGQFQAHKTDPNANRLARDCLERAVALDPDYALAWAWLGLMRLRLAAWSSTGRDGLDQAAVAAARALALDPAESWCHLVAGQVAMYQGDLARAEVMHKKASALNPFDANVMALRSPLATYLGKPEEGLQWIERAMALNPRYPDWYVTNKGLAAYCAGRYADAAAAYAEVATPQTGVLAGLAASLAMLGDAEGAARAAKQVLEREPGFSVERLVAPRPFRHEADREHLREGLVRAGLPD